MKRPILWMCAPLLAAAVFWTGFQTARDDDFYAMRKNFELFGSVYEQVVGSYMVRVDPERFMRSGMDAMLETLDPWTDFLDEADNVAMQLRGQPGIGEVPVNLGSREGRVTVLAPEALTGAYLQGVQTGDVFVSVDGQPADSLSVVEVRELLRGEPGTTVEVTLLREGEGNLPFVLKREPPITRFVGYTGRVEGTDVALVKLDAFGPGAAREVDDALEDLEDTGAVTGLVLDLRDNPGGLVNEAIDLVGLFVPKGTPVVSTRGRSPESNRLYATSDEPDYPDLPLVVLVNRGSASASEIVSGALQDLDRAVIVGEATFGKGLVQVVRPLPYNTSLKITFSRYFTPAGRGIRKDALEEGGEPARTFRTTNGRNVREGNGIEPDVAVPLPEAGPLVTALLREAAFFRFAGVLVAQEGDALRAASAASNRLEMPSDTPELFRSWLREDGFVFDSELLSRTESVAEIAPSGADAALETLRRLAAEEENTAFRDAEERILALLRQEVAARILPPDERIRRANRADPTLADGLDLLQSGRYTSVLGG